MARYILFLHEHPVSVARSSPAEKQTTEPGAGDPPAPSPSSCQARALKRQAPPT